MIRPENADGRRVVKVCVKKFTGNEVDSATTLDVLENDTTDAGETLAITQGNQGGTVDFSRWYKHPIHASSEFHRY